LICLCSVSSVSSRRVKAQDIRRYNFGVRTNMAKPIKPIKPKKPERTTQGKFGKGNCANPAGRPPDTKRLDAQDAIAYFKFKSYALTVKAVELALAGDTVLLKAALAKILPDKIDLGDSLSGGLAAIARAIFEEKQARQDAPRSFLDIQAISQHPPKVGRNDGF